MGKCSSKASSSSRGFTGSELSSGATTTLVFLLWALCSFPAWCQERTLGFPSNNRPVSNRHLWSWSIPISRWSCLLVSVSRSLCSTVAVPAEGSIHCSSHKAASAAGDSCFEHLPWITELQKQGAVASDLLAMPFPAPMLCTALQTLPSRSGWCSVAKPPQLDLWEVCCPQLLPS